jgi:hypothetical protein
MAKNTSSDIELRAWQDAAIEEGLRAAEEGRVVDHERVVEWVESWGTDNELPMPTSNPISPANAGAQIEPTISSESGGAVERERPQRSG